MGEHDAAGLLVFHGALVFFAGILAGFPYGVLRVRGGSDEAIDNWRVAHVQNLQNGFLLLIVAACSPYVELSPSLRGSMSILLIAAAYTDLAAWTIRPITGHAGLQPGPPVWNNAVFMFFAATVVGQTLGVGLLIYGAWSGLG